MNICVLCGKQFEPRIDQPPEHKYCSCECSLDAYMLNGKVVSAKKLFAERDNR